MAGFRHVVQGITACGLTYFPQMSKCQARARLLYDANRAIVPPAFRPAGGAHHDQFRHHPTNQKIQTAIKATPNEVWSALIDGNITPAYYYGYAAEFDLTAGSAYRYSADGVDAITGTVIAVNPGKSLVTTFNGAYDPEVAALPESTVTFTVSNEVLPMPSVTMLSITHEGLPQSIAAEKIAAGWVVIASGLKTLLETGSPLVAPPVS